MLALFARSAATAIKMCKNPSLTSCFGQVQVVSIVTARLVAEYRTVYLVRLGKPLNRNRAPNRWHQRYGAARLLQVLASNPA